MGSRKHKNGKKQFSIAVAPKTELDEEKEGEVKKKIIGPLKKSDLVSDISLLRSKGDFETEIQELVESRDLDVIFTIGGTGIGKRENTVEIIREMFEKEIPGFGELLRFYAKKRLELSEITNRSTAGKKNKKLIFCLPDSPEVAKIGVELIKEDLDVMMQHARK